VGDACLIEAFVEAGATAFFLAAGFLRAVFFTGERAPFAFRFGHLWIARHRLARLKAKFPVTENFGKRFLDSMLEGRVITT
jgi:hypothetical protein